MMLDKLYESNSKAFVTFLITGFVLYLFALKGPFIFDDSTFIVQNKHIQQFEVKKIYTGCLTDGAYIGGGDCNFYRPNQALIHALVFKLDGLNPFYFHLASFLAHILNTFLIFSLLLLLRLSRKASFAAALMFLIHPMQTEAVSYISGLSDPLALLFMLSAIYVFYQSLQKTGVQQLLFFVVVTLLYVLALFTKESAVTLSVLLFLPLLLFDKKEIKKSSTYLTIAGVLFLGVTITYMYLKFNVFNFTGTIGLTSQQNEYTQSIWVRLTTFITILPHYFAVLFFPFVLYIERPYQAFASLNTPLGKLGFLLLGIVVGLMSFSMLKKKRVIIMAILWFFVAIAPVSGIIPINAIYLEHWLYIPSVGLVILLAYLVQQLKGRQIGYGIFILFTLFFSIRTIARNYQWGDAIRFYKNEIKHNSRSARIYNNLAMEYAEKKQYGDAIANYQKAIQLYDVYPQTHHNLGRVYLAMGDANGAVQEFYKALAMSPSFAYSQQELAKIYQANNRPDKAKIFSDFFNRTLSGGTPVTFQEIEAVYKMP